MSVFVLKHYYNFSKTFNVILRSISGTDRVDSVGVIILYLTSWDIQKLSSQTDLNKSTESTSTTALGKLFQILTTIERKFPKIIMTSIFESKIITSRYFNDSVNQFRCNFIIICLVILTTSIMSPRNLLYT